MRPRYLAFSLILLLLAQACSCEELVFFDPFEVHEEPDSARPESLHVYASDAFVPLKVRSTRWLADLESLTVTTSGEVELDPDSKPSVSFGILSFLLKTKAAGSGTVALVDESGAVQAERELSIVDVDEISLSVTAPAQQGIELPSVDPGKLRVFVGSSAGLRTSLFAEGEEVFGTHAVEVTASDSSVSGRRASACARQGCAASRSAVELRVSEDATDETQAVLSAGKASITVTVVPTAEADLTSLKTMGPVAEAEEAERQALAAVPHVEEEPVFGAPVVWSVDGEALETTGDLLRFDEGEGRSTVTAALGSLEESFTLDVAVTNASVTSITATCGQAAGGKSAIAPVFALLLVLGVSRRRGV